MSVGWFDAKTALSARPGPYRLWVHRSWQRGNRGNRQVPRWYAHAARPIEIASGTAVWDHAGRPTLPIRWVLIHDPKGKFKTQALLCTDQKTDPVQIVKWFVLRWQIEVTYHEVREH